MAKEKKPTLKQSRLTNTYTVLLSRIKSSFNNDALIRQQLRRKSVNKNNKITLNKYLKENKVNRIKLRKKIKKVKKQLF